MPVRLIPAHSSGISDAARERIAADVGSVAADPVIVERLTATVQIVSPGSAVEFGASIDEQTVHLAATARILSIKPKQ